MIIDENSCIEARHVIPALHLGLTQSLLFLYTSCKTRRTYGGKASSVTAPYSVHVISETSHVEEKEGTGAL